jgi:hypothetical protein
MTQNRPCCICGIETGQTKRSRLKLPYGPFRSEIGAYRYALCGATSCRDEFRMVYTRIMTNANGRTRSGHVKLRRLADQYRPTKGEINGFD